MTPVSRESFNLTPEERAAAGREARERAPRSGMAVYEPPAGRTGPLEVLAEQDRTRVPELVPVRYGRMLASAFTFYRGAAAIMAQDLAEAPRTGLTVQLCGDAHLSNFGAFRAPDRSLVFDVNDFDETHPGPFEWDLKRLAASLAIGGRDRRFVEADRRVIVTACIREYARAMRELAGMRELDVWYARIDVEETIARAAETVSKEQRKRAEKNIEKAKNKDSLRALAKLTERDGDTVRIANRPPLLVPIEEAPGLVPGQVEEVVQTVLGAYKDSLSPSARALIDRYHYVHAAHKVVGVGSVGNRAWIALLVGRDADDPLFLQFKEAQASVLERYTEPSEYRTHGQRVVEGQRLTQAASDQLLGWLRVEGLDGVERDFYARQLWDGKGSAEIELMDAEAMGLYARLCGGTLALAHARTGDPIAISSYLGGGRKFSRAMADFAEAYAIQNQADFETVEAAAEDGELEVQAGL